jgi:hypothetical protein
MTKTKAAKAETWWCIKPPSVALLPWTSTTRRKYSIAKICETSGFEWSLLKRQGYKAVKIKVEEADDQD